MRKILNKNFRKGERGNVLFLILIAVALFAALSYAVTTSSRSGGGDANDETNLVNSASLTQYPSAVRTSIIRMLVSKGVDSSELAFNKPPYTNLDTANLQTGVFHPSGGGSVYAPASADVMADNAPGDWFFNGNLELENIGTAGAGGGDIIAYLPGVRRSVCEKINEELGIVAPPTINADLSASIEVDMVDSDGDITTAPTNFPATPVDVIEVATTNTLAGVPFGCFINPSTPAQYVYFHVIVER